MSCVAGERAAGARRYYITLIMRACAKGGTGPRRTACPVSFVWKRTVMLRRGGEKSGTELQRGGGGGERSEGGMGERGLP